MSPAQANEGAADIRPRLQRAVLGVLNGGFVAVALGKRMVGPRSPAVDRLAQFLEPLAEVGPHNPQPAGLAAVLGAATRAAELSNSEVLLEALARLSAEMPARVRLQVLPEADMELLATLGNAPPSPVRVRAAWDLAANAAEAFSRLVVDGPAVVTADGLCLAAHTWDSVAELLALEALELRGSAEPGSADIAAAAAVGAWMAAQLFVLPGAFGFRVEPLARVCHLDAVEAGQRSSEDVQTALLQMFPRGGGPILVSAAAELLEVPRMAVETALCVLNAEDRIGPLVLSDAREGYFYTRGAR